MGGLFSTKAPKAPKLPPVQAPAPVPTTDEAKDNIANNDMLRKRRGRAASVLTSSAGDLTTPMVGTKTLLGS